MLTAARHIRLFVLQGVDGSVQIALLLLLMGGSIAVRKFAYEFIVHNAEKGLGARFLESMKGALVYASAMLMLIFSTQAIIFMPVYFPELKGTSAISCCWLFVIVPGLMAIVKRQLECLAKVMNGETGFDEHHINCQFTAVFRAYVAFPQRYLQYSAPLHMAYLAVVSGVCGDVASALTNSQARSAIMHLLLGKYAAQGKYNEKAGDDSTTATENAMTHSVVHTVAELQGFVTMVFTLLGAGIMFNDTSDLSANFGVAKLGPLALSMVCELIMGVGILTGFQRKQSTALSTKQDLYRYLFGVDQISTFALALHSAMWVPIATLLVLSIL